MTVHRKLCAGEPRCPECDRYTGNGVKPYCTCGRSYDERKADGFRDAVGLIPVLWLSKEEMLERYPDATADEEEKG